MQLQSQYRALHYSAWRGKIGVIVEKSTTINQKHC